MGFNCNQWFPGGPRIPKNPFFFWKKEKIIQNPKTQKRLEICQNKRYALWPEVSDQSGSVVSTMFCKANSAKKTFFCVAIFYNFQTKMFKSLKILDIRLWDVWAKRRLNGTSKVNRRTDGQTDRQTDILTYRKHRPRGLMLWKYKKKKSFFLTVQLKGF